MRWKYWTWRICVCNWAVEFIGYERNVRIFNEFLRGRNYYPPRLDEVVPQEVKAAQRVVKNKFLKRLSRFFTRQLISAYKEWTKLALSSAQGSASNAAWRLQAYYHKAFGRVEPWSGNYPRGAA